MEDAHAASADAWEQICSESFVRLRGTADGPADPAARPGRHPVRQQQALRSHLPGA
ncbi:hypothetical protein OG407_47505 [Streptomyces sp. NBC_01515]|uniref:hypothetical protein n=1 Tax=Streptomyces sp. NBC_01515 TaxID=2903890 RepID=UPI003867D263